MQVTAALPAAGRTTSTEPASLGGLPATRNAAAWGALLKKRQGQAAGSPLVHARLDLRRACVRTAHACRVSAAPARNVGEVGTARPAAKK